MLINTVCGFFTVARTADTYNVGLNLYLFLSAYTSLNLLQGQMCDYYEIYAIYRKHIET